MCNFNFSIYQSSIIAFAFSQSNGKAVSYPLLVVMIVLISLDSLILIVYIKKNRTMKQH